MPRIPTVLLVPGDRLTGLLTANGLQVYGYDVRTARNPEEAIAVLDDPARQDRIGVLVIDVDLGGERDGLFVAELARRRDPSILVIYTARQPHRVPERRRVRGAPILSTPYHPQQVAGLIMELRSRSDTGSARGAA